MRCEKINISGSFYRNKCKYMACECVGMACATGHGAWLVTLNVLSREAFLYPYHLCCLPIVALFFM